VASALAGMKGSSNTSVRAKTLREQLQLLREIWADILPDDLLARISAAFEQYEREGFQPGFPGEPQLEALEKRFAAIEAKGFDLSKARFQAGFGRRLEYYTGFVFELQVPELGPEKVIAGGGRYDGLLKSLGASQSVPAVGCAFTVERLARALKAKGVTK
jgi:histidyl-tRNA synthetase